MDSVNVPWQAYRHELLGFIRRRVADASIAEDLVHEVLLKAYQHRQELADSRRLRAWLYQITRNTIVDYYRRYRPEEALPADIVSESPEVAIQAQQDLALCLRPLLNHLPLHYRQAVWQVDIEGLKQTELAEQLKVSVSTVKSRVQRGRQLLKKAILDCCHIEVDHRGRLSEVNMDNNACRRC